MTATYPTSRRAFTAEEAWPGFPAFAGVGKAIADWQNYTYNADLPISPADAKVFGETGFVPWQTDAVGDMSPSPQRTGSNFNGGQLLSVFYLPPPRIPVSGQRIWVYVVLSASTPVGSINIKSLSTEAAYSTAVTYAALGSATSGWLSVDCSFSAGDVVEIRLQHSSGAGTMVAKALSGYHLPSTLWGSAASWSAISQVHPADDRPLHSHAIRWLMKSCNRFAMHRAPLQFLSSYLGEWAVGNTAGFGAETVPGRYKVLIGERVTSLRIAILAKSSGSCTLLVKVDGVTKHTFTVNSGTYAWQEASISITGGTAATVSDLVLEWGGEATTNIKVPSVSLWEETATLTLPGAETVPGAFVANDNGGMASGYNITSAQWKRMVENMVWIWKNRGLRSLICDSRFTSCGQAVDHDAPGADHESQGVRRFRFADLAGVPRFVEHSHGWDWSGWGESHVWVDEATAKASAATATRINAPAASEAFPSFNEGIPAVLHAGGVFSGATMAMQTSPPWVTAAAQTQDYEAWCQRGGVSTITCVRLAGLIIEQLPKNQTAGTRV